MNVAIEKLPECRAKILAAVPAKTVSDIRNGVLTEFMKKAKIPGFRPGKLPRKVVEQKFAAGIEEELKESLSRAVLKEAVEKQNLGFLGFAKIEREVFEADGTYTFNCEVIIAPDFEITETDYKNIPVNVVVEKVTDDMVEEWLGRVQVNFATYADSDEPADHLDRVMISYSAHRDGKPLAEQLKPELAPLAHRDDEFELVIPGKDAEGHELIPGISTGIIGVRPGESRDIPVEFGEDFMFEELRGIQATYTVKVHSIKKAILPPIDDELAQRIGGPDLETVRRKFIAMSEERFETNRINQIEDQIISHLNKEHQFEIPKEQVYSETKHQVNQIVSNAFSKGMKPDDLDNYEKQIIDNATTRAETNVRTRYILSEIAEKEAITETEDEIYQQIFMLAQKQRIPIKRFARELHEKNGIESIKANIRISKTIAFLREHASITEVETQSEPTD